MKHESLTTARGHSMYFGGNEPHQGFGIILSRRFNQQICSVIFHVYSARVCALHFQFGDVHVRVFSCYLPTGWDQHAIVEEVYELMTHCVGPTAEKTVPYQSSEETSMHVLARNISLHACDDDDDDVDSLGGCGEGPRNERRRGRLLVDWVIQHNLQIVSRTGDPATASESWTCVRNTDGLRVQFDYIFAYFCVIHVDSWCDFAIGLGLDHRCVHCV